MAFYNSYTGSMDPKYVFPASRLGHPTSPQSSKQLEDFGKALNGGVKNVEVGALQLEKFEGIPKQHMDEIKRLSKLTGSKISLHGPLIDLSGFGERQWTEHQRQEAEQQMASVLDRAKKLDANGGIPVVFHSAHHAFAGVFDKRVEDENKKAVIDELKEHAEKYKRIYEQRHDPIYLEEAKKLEEEAKDYEKGKKKVMQALGIVNQDTGEINIVQLQKKKIMGDNIGEVKESVWTPEKKLETINNSQWEDEKLKMLSLQKQLDEIQERMKLKQDQILALNNTGLKDSPEYSHMFESNQRDIELMSQHIQNIEKDRGAMELAISDKFNKWAGKEEKELFNERAKELAKQEKALIEQYNKMWDKQKEEIKNRPEEEQRQVEHALALQLKKERDKIKLSAISAMDAPQIWRPIEEFAQEQLVETVSNALIHYAEEHKKEDLSKAPVVAIENFFPNSPMSTAETLRDAIQKTRASFAKKLSSHKDFKDKFDKKEAEKIAEKLIGATWDMGHINQLRRAGYSEDELKKRVIEETQHIADVVKHVHITDNFGFSDAHLPPGMGNVPVREILSALEEKGFKGRGIVEAGNFVGEFGINPQHSVMEFFNSPMYYDFDEQRARQRLTQPYWAAERPNSYQDYFIEFPQHHFDLYSSSFSTMPKIFGGQVSGDKSRFSGTPNQ